MARPIPTPKSKWGKSLVIAVSASLIAHGLAVLALELVKSKKMRNPVQVIEIGGLAFKSSGIKKPATPKPKPVAPKPVAPKAPTEPTPQAKAPAPSAAPPPPPAPLSMPTEKQLQEQMAKHREEVRKAVSKKGILGVIGGKSSAAGSVFSEGGRSANLDKLLSNAGSGELRIGASGGGGGGDGTGDGSLGAENQWKGRTVADAGGALTEKARSVAAASPKVVEIEKRTEETVESAEVGQLDDLSMKEAVAMIHRTVDTYLGGIRYLYNRELRKNPDLEGKVVIAITIDPDGSVVGAEVKEATMNAPELVDGILARVKRWTFPPVAPKRITVTYPFVFFPSM
jgi:TonB family protein